MTFGGLFPWALLLVEREAAVTMAIHFCSFPIDFLFLVHIGTGYSVLII